MNTGVITKKQIIVFVDKDRRLVIDNFFTAASTNFKDQSADAHIRPNLQDQGIDIEGINEIIIAGLAS
jgi:hypothetical protein